VREDLDIKRQGKRRNPKKKLATAREKKKEEQPKHLRERGSKEQKTLEQFQTLWVSCMHENNSSRLSS
jgi:hypothetical protein